MAVGTRNKGARARRLADIVLRQLDPLVAKQGFGEASLLMQWREIVGARIAGVCHPVKLQWPPRRRDKPTQTSAPKRETPQEPAILVLRVEPGFGLEAQHLAPAIIDRVNAHLGWRCVSRVSLRQEAIDLGASTHAARKPLTLPDDPAARARAEAATAGVSDALRASLVRLGESALAGMPEKKCR